MIIYGHGVKIPTLLYTDANGVVKVREKISSLNIHQFFDI